MGGVSWGDEGVPPSGRKHAQQLLVEGAALHDKGDDAGALQRFQQAYAEYPNPRLLFNIAQMLADLGDNADAADAFSQFLESGATDPSLAQSDSPARARVRLGQLQPTIGRVELVVSPAGSTIEVDGRRRQPGPLYLSPGAHQLVVTHDAYESSTQIVAISAGQQRNLTVSLASAQPRAAELVPPRPTSGTTLSSVGGLTPAVSTSEPGSPANVPARVAFGVAAAVAVGAAVMSGITLSQYNRLPSESTMAPSHWSGAYATELTDARISDALWAGAAVSAATGLGLWLLVAPTGGGGGEVEAGVRF